MQLPSVAIVILNYNGKNFLEKFLPSVMQSNYDNMIIVVADNASTDGSAEWVKNHYPSIQLIQLKENLGFAEGYNQALQQIQTDYYILLNSDVEVDPDWINPIIELMESKKDIGICQPKILSYSQKDHFEYAGAAGGWLDILGYPFARGRVFDSNEKDIGQYKSTEDIFWASGAALFIRRNIWEKLGGFDGYLFAHQEEIDLCWRAQLAGFKIAYCNQSVVYHIGGGTLSKSNPRKTYLNFRNSLIILSKNLPTAQAFTKIFCRLILDGVFGIKLIFSFQFSDVIAIIKAHFGFYKWLFRSKKTMPFTKRNLETLQGVAHQSIVWAYFIKKKKTFSEIIYKK